MGSPFHKMRFIIPNQLLSLPDRTGDVIPFSSFRAIENFKKNANYEIMLEVEIITGNTAGVIKHDTLFKKV
jgi:hypothetical protein